MNVANVLTSFRILVIPFLVVIILSDFRGREILSASLFATAWLTDWLDGFWARKNGKTSVLGQILDPTADKLLVVSVFVCLVGRGVVEAWLAVIIIGRELAVSGFRAIAASRGVNIPASLMGKVKMAFESATLTLLLLGETHLGPLYPVARAGLWTAAAVSLLSGLEYYLRYLPRLGAGRRSPAENFSTRRKD